MLSLGFKKLAELIFELDTRWAFATICVFYLIVALFQQYFILTDDMYFNSWGEQIAYERIEEMVNNQKQNAWIGYVIIPLLATIQIFLITICLSIGVLLKNDKVSFEKLFTLVTKVSIVPAFFKVIVVLMIVLFYKHTVRKYI